MSFPVLLANNITPDILIKNNKIPELINVDRTKLKNAWSLATDPFKVS